MPTTGNPALDALLIYGPLGIVVVLFVLGKLHSDGELQRERSIADTVLTNNTSLTESLRRLADFVEADGKARRGAR